MSYAILLTTEARHHLARLPAAVRNQTIKQLDVLSEWATELSVPSHFPFRENCQLFLFDATNADGSEWDLNVMFQYASDEQSIHVLAIGFARKPLTDA